MGLVAGLNFYPQVEIRKGWGRNVEKKDNEQCASIAAQMRPTWLVERLKCIATAYAVSMNSSGMLTRSSIAWSFKPKRWRSIAFPRIACIEGRVGESLSSIKVSNAINFGGMRGGTFLNICQVYSWVLPLGATVSLVSNAWQWNTPAEPTLQFLPMCLWFKGASCSCHIY